jgi:pyruvate dehydrogenase E2 component (dihydrolipoamide acetyltransferase)
MARLEFRLPDIGEGVTEGEIVEWFVRPGDAVVEDDPMVEVMTDKATVTIGAPCDGRVEALRFEVGGVANVGQVILVLEPSAESNVGQAQRSSRPPATAVGEISDELPGAKLFEHASGLETGNRIQTEKPLATPAVRRLAKQLGVDLRRVRGSGEEGRVTESDVHAAAPVHGSNESLEERKPILGVRRKIAERMHRATTTAAHFTFVEECDASRLVDMRGRLAPEAERQGVKLTFVPFIIKAVADALQRHPMLNSAVDEEANELVCKKYYNIGVATATDAGLMVPVVHSADRLSLFEVARRVAELSQAAREGRLEPGDLRGSTFTVTSLGKRGGLLATPILNHPEVGILGIHRIKESPVVRDGKIVVGQVMLLSLSFDHRVIDGHVGADFAYDVIETLENPGRLFYESL